MSRISRSRHSPAARPPPPAARPARTALNGPDHHRAITHIAVGLRGTLITEDVVDHLRQHGCALAGVRR